MTRLPVSFSIPTNQCVSLDEDLRHYVRNVLRMRVGDNVLLFNGDGFDYQAQVCELTKKTVKLDVFERIENKSESPLKITLLQGLAKGDRMDFVMQKATELGVTRIIPVITEYCSVKVTDSFCEKKTAHWQHVANFASAQSGRAVMPIVDVPIKLGKVFSTIDECDIKWTMSPNGESLSCKIPSTNVNHAAILIGPEGGLSDNDLDLAKSHFFDEICFGKRILRTETAALTALASIQTLLGDF